MALAVTLVPAQAGSGDRKICLYNRGNTPSGVPEGKPGSQSQGRCSLARVSSIPLFSLHIPDFCHVNREAWVSVWECAV